MRCPICKNKLTPDTSEHRPFCSQRCKTIDLGKWLTEDYRVPVTDDQEEDGTSMDGEVPFKPEGTG